MPGRHVVLWDAYERDGERDRDVSRGCGRLARSRRARPQAPPSRSAGRRSGSPRRRRATTTRPDSATSSSARCASRYDSPPRTGVPTPGATSGSTTSMSRLTCTNPGPATWASDSRIARSTPRRSTSLIVNTFAPSARTRSRSPSSSERTPTSATRSRIDRRRRPRSALERRPAEAEHGREHHPVDVAGRRGLRRVQVAVRVEPEDAAAAVRRRQATDRADGHRVVAAEHERHRARLGGAPHERRNPFARAQHGQQVARVRLADLGCFGDSGLDVAPVLDSSPDLREPRVETCVPDRRRSHVDAATSLSEVERRADHGDRLACVGGHPRE